MAKDLIEGGNKFLQKYQQSEKLVDVYNKAWIQKQVQDNDDFYFIQQDDFARWSKESHRRIEGHLYLLKIEDDDNQLKTELVGLFPWLKAYFAASIGKEQIHDPDIIFFNNVMSATHGYFSLMGYSGNRVVSRFGIRNGFPDVVSHDKHARQHQNPTEETHEVERIHCFY